MEILWKSSFLIVSSESPETMWKLCLSTKFPRHEIRWNYNVLRSLCSVKNKQNNFNLKVLWICSKLYNLWVYRFPYVISIFVIFWYALYYLSVRWAIFSWNEVILHWRALSSWENKANTDILFYIVNVTSILIILFQVNSLYLLALLY